MEKVPFIYRLLLFGTGAIKAQQCYLSLQKGFVRHRAEGKKGKEKAKEGGDHWKLAETEGQTVYLFIPMSLPLLRSSPTVLSQFTCCGKIHGRNEKNSFGSCYCMESRQVYGHRSSVRDQTSRVIPIYYSQGEQIISFHSSYGGS